MSDYDYDLFVIGGGSGGVRAARIASQYGARVAVAEEYRYGGTCVIRGCVPKKLFVYASHFAEEFADAAGFGWTVEGTSFDWQTLVANKDVEIERLSKIYVTNLEKAGVEVFRSRAELRDAHTVELISEGRKITAERILIAVGAAPYVPEFEGSVHAITSNEAFHLDHLPQSITIVGGGYIAVEFAGIFNGLGVDTTLLYRGEQILRGFDDDLRNHLAEEMTKKGITVHTGAHVESIKQSGDHFTVATDTGKPFDTGLVMYATGRWPKIEGLGLDNAGIEVRDDGAIIVNGFSQTNVPNIYAIGDVTHRMNLTPVAIREGHAFADTVYGDKPTAVDHDNIATAVFSQPELGTVGLTEAKARETYDEIDIYRSVFRPMKHTLSGSDEKMMMKLIVDAASDKVLGCHIMGPDAGEMAQVLGIAVKMGATKADFDATIAVHPTAAEELVTMREKVAD